MVNRAISGGTIDERRTFLGMEVIVASKPMRSVLELAERVAKSQATVLIAGESGCGKELVARAIHHYSARASKPWVDLNCAAIPEHLLESELFGYERGAFSGAEQAKPGLFEMAHGGTIFLDEIGELDPRVQVKLLRVLDGAAFYRLGGTRKVTVDVRVVAASNRDLLAAVEQGRFRGDLYHRLSQFILRVPPLRERVEDIEPLASYFLGQQNAHLSFSQSAIALMEAHRWSGNIRELRNAVISAAIWAKDEEIGEEDLHGLSPAIGVTANGANLDSIEKQAILAALALTGGHQQKAAARLGISRRTLHRKLKQYRPQGIELTV